MDAELVCRLVRTQFPHWADLAVCPVVPGGWDNKSFRLGEHMLVRLPSAQAYALQVQKEHRWLPMLAPKLALSIPQPLALGAPAEGCPWRWSIYRWIEGDTAAPERIADLRDFAARLAQFLVALQSIDSTGGPAPGPHNFHRGGPLTHCDAEARQAIAALAGRIDVDTATEVWEAALATSWHGPPVWLQGDVSAGNLLVKGGRLIAVIDFGQLGVGDPACDLAIAWTLLGGAGREVLRARLGLDSATWARGRGWTLWKALIVAAGLAKTDAVEAARPWHIIAEVLADHRRSG